MVAQVLRISADMYAGGSPKSEVTFPLLTHVEITGVARVEMVDGKQVLVLPGTVNACGQQVLRRLLEACGQRFRSTRVLLMF